MDADDVSLPERFAVQLPVIESGADLVGSALVEFEVDEDAHRRDSPAARHGRADQDSRPGSTIRSTIRRWCTAKSAVPAAGGYRELPLMEDYWLFARMIQSGARVANVPEPLVKYRVGAGAYARRGAGTSLRSEVALQGHLRRGRICHRAASTCVTSSSAAGTDSCPSPCGGPLTAD